MFIFPEDVDTRFGWAPGRAERLARRRQLPHVLLPDGSIRFNWDELESLLVRVSAVPVGGEGRHDE